MNFKSILVSSFCCAHVKETSGVCRVAHEARHAGTHVLQMTLLFSASCLHISLVEKNSCCEPAADLLPRC